MVGAAVIARRDDADRALELVRSAAQAGREVHVAVYDGDESLASVRVSAAGLAAVIADEAEEAEAPGPWGDDGASEPESEASEAPKDFLLFPSTFAPLPAAEETPKKPRRLSPPRPGRLSPVQGASPLFPRVTPPNEVALEPVRALFRPASARAAAVEDVAAKPPRAKSAPLKALRGCLSRSRSAGVLEDRRVSFVDSAPPMRIVG